MQVLTCLKELLRDWVVSARMQLVVTRFVDVSESSWFQTSLEVLEVLEG